MSYIKHTVDFHVQESWARMNMLAWSYSEIAESAYDDYLEVVEKAIPLPNDDDPSEYFKSSRRIRESSFKTIVFSGMACESAIYDLAAIHLGDDYVSKYVDKLDVIGKWVIVPSLICGKSLNTEGAALNSLRSLIRRRNSLVHHKSLPGFGDEDAPKKANKQIEIILDGTHDAFKSVVLLSLELNRIMGVRSGVLPFFEGDTISSSDTVRSTRIEKVIQRCRVIDVQNSP